MSVKYVKLFQKEVENIVQHCLWMRLVKSVNYVEYARHEQCLG